MTVPVPLPFPVPVPLPVPISVPIPDSGFRLFQTPIIVTFGKFRDTILVTFCLDIYLLMPFN